MPAYDCTTSLPTEPLSLMTVEPLSVMALKAEIAPVLLEPSVIPSVTLVPEGDKVAPGDTTKLPLTAPMPAKVWPPASVKVWSERALKSNELLFGLEPAKKIRALSEMET